MCNIRGARRNAHFTKSQKRHNRRGKIREQVRNINKAIIDLDNAILEDNISDAVTIVYQYPQFKSQTLICSVQSISMAQALVDIGVPCNFWTLEGAETQACVDFIRNHTSIRG
jgi:hypothetical protein